MAREPFTSEDLDALTIVLNHFPMAGDLVRLVRRIEQAATYPITSCVALEEALGGDEGTIRFAGKDWPASTLHRVIPAYYFPIASSADLAAKLAELARQRRHRRKGHDMGWGHDMPPGSVAIKRHFPGIWGRHHHHHHGGPPWARGWAEEGPESFEPPARRP